VASREALSRALDEARASVALASRAAIEGYERITIFIRLYSRDTRPWIGFHTDLSTVTVNVALSADTSHKGGHLHTIASHLGTFTPSSEPAPACKCSPRRHPLFPTGGHLHAILEGKHQIVEREEGEATVHTDDVMHGVSAMRGGERCAFLILILFLKVLTTAPPPLTSPSRSPLQVRPHPLLLPRVSDDVRFGHGAGQQREARGE